MHRVALLVATFVSVVTIQAAEVSICDVLADPPAYDRQSIEITGFVSQEFENFTIGDPRCRGNLRGVWLEYGGQVPSGTVYCCGIDDSRSRPEPLVVDGVTTTIVRDRKLKQFDKWVGEDLVVHATLRGHYFAGEKQTWPGGTIRGGYGHFGLYTLFVIEQVIDIDAHDLRNIDYHASIDQPGEDVECVLYLYATPPHELIRQQREAESGRRAWSFTEPARVANENLRDWVGADARLVLRRVRTAPGRMVFKGTVAGKKNEYMVVVSRPYWLSFEAVKRSRVAWVAIAAYEIGCGE
jgi:hypothetical protein